MVLLHQRSDYIRWVDLHTRVSQKSKDAGAQDRLQEDIDSLNAVARFANAVGGECRRSLLLDHFEEHGREVVCAGRLSDDAAACASV